VTSVSVDLGGLEREGNMPWSEPGDRSVGDRELGGGGANDAAEILSDESRVGESRV
jgi:hypothetical protein